MSLLRNKTMKLFRSSNREKLEQERLANARLLRDLAAAQQREQAEIVKREEEKRKTEELRRREDYARELENARWREEQRRLDDERRREEQRLQREKHARELEEANKREEQRRQAERLQREQHARELEEAYRREEQWRQQEATRKRLEKEAEEYEEKQRRIKQKKMRNASPETLRDLRELIRGRYQLDVEIWNLRGVRKPDQPLVVVKMEKADDIMGEIMAIVNSWSDNDDGHWNEEEWARVQEIQQRLNSPGKRQWAGNPPWADKSSMGR